MKIVADSHIPYLDPAVVPGATLVKCDVITSAHVRDADALLVRTRTRCDADLLRGSAVKFVGSATIGTDHIDADYCHRHGIVVANAPGCNAPAVAQWVLSVVGHWLKSRGIAGASGLTMGIVGVGHVGSIVARWARQLGFEVLLNDPPREAQGDDSEQFVSLGELQERSHIITFHTPLTREGEWRTWHLCDDDFLQRAQRCRLLMNAARGPVCSTQALLRFNGDLAIDCWEGEPEVDARVLERVFVGTPHIAGYSRQGKQRGTRMVLEALARHTGQRVVLEHIDAPAQGAVHVTMQRIIDSYDPLADTARLKAEPQAFEAQRNHYALRTEVS